MLTGVTQRWRERRGTYRPVGEPIDPRRFEVAELPRDTEARAFVVEHHYSGSYPAARFRFGLFRSSELVGVAIFSVPVNYLSTEAIPGAPADKVELGRFVLLDDVPSNGESWFLARAFALVRGRVSGIVSYSDPCARLDTDGRRIFPGHIGTIYQATNAAYLGRGPRRTWRLLPDGTVLSARAIQKIRGGERGWRPAAGVLERFGADAPGADRLGWLHHWLPALTRPFRHGGCHKYAWSFEAKLSSLPYPKWS